MPLHVINKVLVPIVGAKRYVERYANASFFGSWDEKPYDFPLCVVLVSLTIIRTMIINTIMNASLIALSVPFAFFPYWRPKFFKNPTSTTQKQVSSLLWFWLITVQIVVWPIIALALLLLFILPFISNIRVHCVQLVDQLILINISDFVNLLWSLGNYLKPLSYHNFECNILSLYQSPICYVQSIILLPYTLLFAADKKIVDLFIFIVRYLFVNNTGYISKISFILIWNYLLSSFVKVLFNMCLCLYFPELNFELTVRSTSHAFITVLSWTIGIPARICYKLGILGQLILIPITIAWMFWPMLIPFYLYRNNAL